MADDFLDRLNLPAAVRDRIESLRDTAADLHRALKGISDDRQELWAKRSDAEGRLHEHRRDGLTDDDPPLPELLAEVKKQGAKLAKLSGRADKLGGEHQHALRLVNNLEAYLRSHAAGGLSHYTGPSPQLANGETALDGLERAARRTRTLQADRRDVLAAPFPTSVAKKLARAQLAARAEAAKPDVVGLVEHCDPIRFPLTGALSEAGLHRIDTFVTDPIGALAWLFPKEMQAAIDKEIDANGDDKAALSAEQRTAKLVQIDGDILASEREEAAFAELAGLMPRHDLNPRAVLQLADNMPAPRHDD